MPTREDWIYFERKRATRRGAAMVQEARRLFTKRTGKPGPAISQGGRSGSVGASGGTHLREAFDFRTGHLSASNCRIWEECLWAVGFAAWWRPYVFNLWPQHHHAIPKGGDLAPAARSQELAFKARRNGLRSNLRYPRIGKYTTRTWEQYLRSRPKPAPKPAPKPKPLKNFRLSTFKGAVKPVGYNRGYPSHVAVCQTALQALGYKPGVVDGIKGKATVAAMNRFLAKWGWDKATGRIIDFRQLDRLIWEAEKLHPGTGYPPRAEK